MDVLCAGGKEHNKVIRFINMQTFVYIEYAHCYCLCCLLVVTGRSCDE